MTIHCYCIIRLWIMTSVLMNDAVSLLILCSSGKRWWINQSIWKISGIIMTRENRRNWGKLNNLEKTYPNATLSTISPTKIGLGLNLGLPHERLATNRLSHRMDSWIMNNYFTKQSNANLYPVHRTNFYAWVDVLQSFWSWGVITQIFIFSVLHTSMIHPNS